MSVLRLFTGARVYSSSFKDGTPTEDVYFSRLLKLVPGEIAALYTFGAAILQTVSGQVFCTVASLGALILLRAVATRSSVTGRPQWGAVAISAISFLIWLCVLGGPFETWMSTKLHFDSSAAAFVMALWVTVLPFIYKGSGTA
jgi:hypothetical protein